MFTESVAERFAGKYIPVTESGCWIWTGWMHRGGYGRMHIGNRYSQVHLAHRISYELHIGHIPDGLDVLHSCDVPGCVNPDHLFTGTQDDNMKDMVRKGRADRTKKLKGESHSCAKLTDADIDMIRRDSRSPCEIAAQFGIIRNYVYILRRGERRRAP